MQTIKMLETSTELVVTDGHGVGSSRRNHESSGMASQTFELWNLTRDKTDLVESTEDWATKFA